MEIHTAQMFGRNEICTSIVLPVLLLCLCTAGKGRETMTLNASQKNCCFRIKKKTSTQSKYVQTIRQKVIIKKLKVKKFKLTISNI